MQYMRIVETLNPKVFAIENVPEVLTACGGSYYAAVREKAESFGYELDSGIVQDCKVGGYTTRKRAVILGSRIGTPKLAHIALAGEYRTAGDAISKVDKSWSNYSDVTKPSSEVEKRMSFVPQGGNYTSIPEEYRTESKPPFLYLPASGMERAFSDHCELAETSAHSSVGEPNADSSGGRRLCKGCRRISASAERSDRCSSR